MKFAIFFIFLFLFLFLFFILYYIKYSYYDVNLIKIEKEIGITFPVKAKNYKFKEYAFQDSTYFIYFECSSNDINEFIKKYNIQPIYLSADELQSTFAVKLNYIDTRLEDAQVHDIKFFESKNENIKLFIANNIQNQVVVLIEVYK